LTSTEQLIADRYKVEKLLARGGMASVYLAHHVGLKRRVALKLLAARDADEGPSAVQRFQREGDALAKLDHPNIVRLHDSGMTPDGGHYLALEFIDGTPLSKLIPDGGMECARTLSLVSQVCSALRHAHERGLVHRDLKADNVVVQIERGRERVKVLDFGLVKAEDQTQSLTRPGQVVGSPKWMAPEQIRGEKVDARTDVYAVGVLLFRCLTGRYPFEGETATATMLAHLEQGIPSFDEAAPFWLNVPQPIEDVVQCCLAKSPDDRYPTMAALSVAIQEAADVSQHREGTPVRTTLRRARVRAVRVVGRKRAVAVGLVGGALFGLVAVALAIGIGVVWRGLVVPDVAIAAATPPDLPVWDFGEGIEPVRVENQAGVPPRRTRRGPKPPVKTKKDVPSGYLGFPD
jgi:serine/threonine-protein kinase